MLPTLTFQSLGGKRHVGIEETGAVTDRISSKLAQAKTGNRKRYVSVETFDPSARNPHPPTNTLGSFNCQLQSQRRRKKRPRSKPKKHLLFVSWPALGTWLPIKADFVYRCEIEQYYTKTQREYPSKAISSARTVPL